MPRMRVILGCILICALLLSTASARACDLCAIYNSVESQKLEEGSARVGLAEQFTYFGTIRNDGNFQANIHHQHLASSITQLYGQYDFSSRFGAQLTLPYINRRYTRFEDGAVERGTVAGLGDMSVLGKAIVYQHSGQESNAFWALSAGLKLPTGNSDRLGEESSESPVPPPPGDESAFHGHDLALGSGSVDVPVGSTFFAQYGRAFVTAEAQYVFRSEGTHDYTFADDFTWLLAPGYYVLLADGCSVMLRLDLSGERKGKDRRAGEVEDDTRMRAWYLGPSLVGMWGSSLSGELALDLPIEIDNSGVQGVPDYKLRAAIVIRY
jgi:hypothetical protein